MLWYQKWHLDQKVLFRISGRFGCISNNFREEFVRNFKIKFEFLSKAVFGQNVFKRCPNQGPNSLLVGRSNGHAWTGPPCPGTFSYYKLFETTNKFSAINGVKMERMPSINDIWSIFVRHETHVERSRLIRNVILNTSTSNPKKIFRNLFQFLTVQKHSVLYN